VDDFEQVRVELVFGSRDGLGSNGGNRHKEKLG
jgi:hypothetical protein